MTSRVGNGVNPGPPALVITGASSGIGHATAKLAVAQGWRCA
jgi:NADP-dependent 3-hydroxy acid dehydrogenase YdfG